MIKTKPRLLQDVIEDNNHLLRTMIERMPVSPAADDWRPAPIPQWLVTLRRERSLEPAITKDTQFKAALQDGKQVLCECHKKPVLLARLNKDWAPICTYSVFIQLAKCGVKVESPTALYKTMCNGKK